MRHRTWAAIKAHPYSLVIVGAVGFNLGLAIADRSLFCLALAGLCSLFLAWAWSTESETARLHQQIEETWARIDADMDEMNRILDEKRAGDQS